MKKGIEDNLLMRKMLRKEINDVAHLCLVGG